MSAPMLVWLTPALFALVLYGIGQGLVKKYIADVAPARFCLFFVVAKALVNFGYFFTHDHPPPLSPEGTAFLVGGVFAYTLDGLGWILYFKSILLGPITIVGTLSAAYPALTVVFARIFLGEELALVQYVGVALVIGGCIGLSYEPSDPSKPVRDMRWIALAAAALALWASAQTIVKYAYGLPNASESNLALFNTIGGALTLGVYGLLYGRRSAPAAAAAAAFADGAGQAGRMDARSGDGAREWMRSLLPMGMMAGGDLGVIVATQTGPISVVTPLTGAYPVVTLAFAYFVLKEKITSLQLLCIAGVLVGMVISPGASG